MVRAVLVGAVKFLSACLAFGWAVIVVWAIGKGVFERRRKPLSGKELQR